MGAQADVHGALSRQSRGAWSFALLGLRIVLAVSAVAATFASAATTIDEALDALVVQSFPEPLPSPTVTLRNVQGQPFSFQDFRGKVVLLNFWATWCVPCRQEMPAMEQLYEAYRDRGLVVVAVNFRESTREVRSFIEELRLTFPMALDGDGVLSRRLAVRGLPVTYLLDREGRILWKAIGSREWDGAHGRAYFDGLLGPPQR